MDPTVILGIIIGISLLIKAIGIESGLKLFVHPQSLMIVLGGVFGATMVHFPITQILKIWGRLRVVFSIKKRDYLKDIEQIVGIAEKIKREGRLSIGKDIEKINDHFLRHGLSLYIDKVSPEHLEIIMQENIQAINQRHDQGILFFEQMGKYAPGFGLLGTLIGLVMLLANMNDPSTLGPNMSIALVTTFYGVLLSNLVFKPLAGRLSISSYEELFQKEMLLKGLLSLANGDSSYIIREKMLIFLSEKDRKKLMKKAIKATK